MNGHFLKCSICAATALACAVCAVADDAARLVHVYEQTFAGGVVSQLSDRTLDTGNAYSTQSAPAKSGYIFTHWSISTAQPISNRDRLGRAKEVASFTLYEETTLTANYLPESENIDNDGIADGWEIYWYGDISQTSESDTDGDGFTFAEELSSGGDPLMYDESLPGGIVWVDSTLLQYNPDNLQPYTVRSEPEGVLFATQSDYLKSGQIIPIPTVSGSFAYWMVDGVRQADRLGRAKDTISVTMPNAAIEIVALAEDDEAKRNALYWYGDATVSMDSDTDGDGYTFAEELASGGNPLMPDEPLPGGIVWADGALLQYNPDNLQPYTVRSEPEGALFATQSDYLKAGQEIPIPSVSGNFAYWTVDGVRQADRLGRARDTLSIMMPERAIEIVAVSESDDVRRNALYWYGDASVAQESDTDGDGYTFAEELAAGTDPLMVDESLPGGIVWADGELHEVNLQPYEQVQGTVVGNEYSELFTSPVAGNGGTSRTFDGAATPTVVDLNEDGRFDLVVETAKGGRTVFLNEGGAGNPQFVETAWNPNWLEPLNNAKTNTIDGLSFDVEPINAVSWSFADVDKDGIVDLLVADVDGRIWYYRGTWNGEEGFANFELSTLNFKLQHKVWGGSYPGFANGLQIAAVDWDDDGDVDLVCGTAEGKLMLLNDPRVGRPVNLRAEAGATSVVLVWDPNVNSRVRGYGIYRSADSNEFAKIENMCPLPRYRDVPPTIQDWFYRVTGKSRLYVTGNSTPIESESIPTDAIYVQMRPSVWLTDTSSFTDTNVEVVVSMNNSMGISADGFSMTFTYDANVLQPVEMKRSGLTANLEGSAQSSVSAGVDTWTFTATGGEIGIGAGEFLRLVFYVKPVHDVTETTVSLVSASVRSEAGQMVSLELPKSAKIDISDASPLQPAVVSLQVGNAAAATGEDFDLPFTITSTEVLTSGVFTVSFDEAMLELIGVNGTACAVRPPYQVVATDSGSLRFAVKGQHSVVTNFSTTVSLSDAQFVDCNGFEVTANDSQGTVLIKNSHPILPAVVSISTEDRKVDTLETVVVPFRVMSSEALASGSFTVTWDPAVLEFSGTSGTSGASGTGGSLAVSSTGDFSISFLAKDQHDISKTLVRLTSATVMDVNGFTVTPAVPVVSTVLIHDANPLLPAEVAIKAGTVSAKTRNAFEVPVTVTSSKVLTDMGVTVSWDESVLELKGVGGAAVSAKPPYRMTGDGSGFTLTFYAKDQHTVKETAITLSDGAAVCTDGLEANVTTESGRVLLTDSNPPVAVNMAIATLDARAESGKPFVIPLGATTDGNLAELTATVEWNAKMLTFNGAEGATVVSSSASSATLTFTASGTHNLFDLDFSAKTITDLQANTIVRVTSAGGTGANGLAAKLTTTLPVESTVLIVRNINKYDPGDIDGDGKYTDADMTLLQNCIKYLSIVSAAPQLASRYASWKLSGKALKAADVNSDGKIDANDMSMLVQFIASWKEANK